MANLGFTDVLAGTLKKGNRFMRAGLWEIVAEAFDDHLRAQYLSKNSSRGDPYGIPHTVMSREMVQRMAGVD